MFHERKFLYFLLLLLLVVVLVLLLLFLTQKIGLCLKQEKIEK